MFNEFMWITQPTSTGYDRKLEIPDFISRSDNDSFEVHEVWFNRHFRRPEVNTGTSGFDRKLEIPDFKMSKSKSTSLIYPFQHDFGNLNYYNCN